MELGGPIGQRNCPWLLAKSAEPILKRNSWDHIASIKSEGSSGLLVGTSNDEQKRARSAAVASHANSESPKDKLKPPYWIGTVTLLTMRPNAS